jgi:2-phosphoglycerate kinase
MTKAERRSRMSAASTDLRHVYWIGGGSGSGKSQVAYHLGREFGLRLYGTDEAMAAHVRRMPSEAAPALAAFLAMDMDERWVERSPEVMLETFHWFRGEGFDLIVEDLLNLPTDPPVVVEGFRLLPHLVQPLLADPMQALWLIPTPELRLAAFESRGSVWAIAGRTSNPATALHNLLERDRMFTERLAFETQRLGLHALHIGIDTPERQVRDEVAAAFRLVS